MPDAATLSVCPPSASLSVPSEIVRTSLVVEPSTSVAVNVIVLPLSEIAKIPAAVMVTSVEPLVFEEITDVVPVPAFTVRLPSLLTLPSTSVAVSVITLPLSEMDSAPAAVRVTPVLPDVFELIIEVVPVPAATVNEPSLEIEPSTSVEVIRSTSVAGL